MHKMKARLAKERRLPCAFFLNCKRATSSYRRSGDYAIVGAMMVTAVCGQLPESQEEGF